MGNLLTWQQVGCLLTRQQVSALKSKMLPNYSASSWQCANKLNIHHSFIWVSLIAAGIGTGMMEWMINFFVHVAILNSTYGGYLLTNTTNTSRGTPECGPIQVRVGSKDQIDIQWDMLCMWGLTEVKWMKKLEHDLKWNFCLYISSIVHSLVHSTVPLHIPVQHLQTPISSRLQLESEPGTFQILKTGLWQIPSPFCKMFLSLSLFLSIT